MIDHARAGAPAEICGVLGGAGDRVNIVLPVANIDPDPHRYLMDPKGLLAALRHLDERGAELLGFYHSHPHSAAQPSQTDLALAFYPECLYAIVSLAEVEAPRMRVFRLGDGQFVETPIHLI